MRQVGSASASSRSCPRRNSRAGHAALGRRSSVPPWSSQRERVSSPTATQASSGVSSSGASSPGCDPRTNRTVQMPRASARCSLEVISRSVHGKTVTASSRRVPAADEGESRSPVSRLRHRADGWRAERSLLRPDDCSGSPRSSVPWLCVNGRADSAGGRVAHGQTPGSSQGQRRIVSRTDTGRWRVGVEGHPELIQEIVKNDEPLNA
jgi:hypothetical protein